MNFNSHAHVERDSAVEAGVVSKSISTHTLTWSVTGGWGHIAICTGISTHTLTWSVTQLYTPCRKTTRISTHTLTWSVTDTKIIPTWENINFNSHAHVERDAHRRRQVDHG